MNEYKITFTLKGEADTYSVHWVERTETSARRAFLKNRKEMGTVAEISDIELIRDDACATKAQERETLEAIKKMVAELGPQSYLATAFEGCFEDAEQNIDDDAACSMKARWEIAERKLQEEKEAHEATKRSLESKLRAAQFGIEELVQKDDERKAALEKMAARTLSPDDLEDFHQLLDDRITVYEEKAEKAAQEIVKYAEDPTGKEFNQAVADHRNYSKQAEYYRDVLGRVVAAAHAGTCCLGEVPA